MLKLTRKSKTKIRTTKRNTNYISTSNLKRGTILRKQWRYDERLRETKNNHILEKISTGKKHWNKERSNPVTERYCYRANYQCKPSYRRMNLGGFSLACCTRISTRLLAELNTRCTRGPCLPHTVELLGGVSNPSLIVAYTKHMGFPGDGAWRSLLDVFSQKSYKVRRIRCPSGTSITQGASVLPHPVLVVTSLARLPCNKLFGLMLDCWDITSANSFPPVRQGLAGVNTGDTNLGQAMTSYLSSHIFYLHWFGCGENAIYCISRATTTTNLQ